MSVPYSLVIIKPLTVGRGEAPEILEKILDNCPVTLRKFQKWEICDTTLFAMTRDLPISDSNLRYDEEKIYVARRSPSWICVFTHIDRVTDPSERLNEYCGPLDHNEWMPHHLRYNFGGYTRFGKTFHPSDTVVHIAKPERVFYETNMLFTLFKETSL